MRKFILLSLAAAATAGAAGVAHAQPDRQSDRSAALTREHVQQQATEAFARMDVNGDGVIDRADRDARRQQTFARLDTDGDGTISREEFAAQRERRREASPQRGLGGMRGFAWRGMRGGPRDGAQPREPMTQDRFVAAVVERFDRLDTDGDGAISADERRSAREQMRRARPGRNSG